MSALSSPFTFRRAPSLAAAALAAVLACAGPARAGTCATQPVPAGLGKECQRFSYVGGAITDEDRIRVELNVRLMEWMQRCFPGHSPAPPEEGEGSVAYVSGILASAPSYMSTATILAEYTPGTYTENGKTCQGADEVRYYVNGARGTVDVDTEIQISSGPTSEQVKQAAAAALEAIKDPAVKGSGELSRLMNVLIALKDGGTEIDDTWYNVQPLPTGNTLSTVPPACFSEYSVAANGYACRPADEAVAACTRHLGKDLVDLYADGSTPLPRYGKLVEYKANDIQRSFNYVAQVHGVEGAAEAACSTITQVFLPRIVEAAKKRSLYGIGNY